VSLRKYLVLVGVALLGPVGDSLLSRGMKEGGGISPHHLPAVVLSILNPWVALGIVLLLGFFASYMMALSWADLTYVLPATSIGYVVLALIARFLLHEHISLTRWLGILLISGGVGVVASGPASSHHSGSAPLEERSADAVSTEVQV
jgi:drug/metabolite transporter (DMT)-like permease